jgi:hypothetical protein
LGAFFKRSRFVVGLGILFFWFLGAAYYYLFFPLEVSPTDKPSVIIYLVLMIITSVYYLVITLKRSFSIEGIGRMLLKALIFAAVMSFLIMCVFTIAIITFFILPNFEPNYILSSIDTLVVISLMAFIYSLVCTPRGSLSICLKSITNQSSGYSKPDLNQAIIFISIFGNSAAFLGVIYTVMRVLVMLFDLSDPENIALNLSASLIPCFLGFIIKFLSFGFQLKHESYLVKIDQLESKENYRQYRKKTRPSLIALILIILASIALITFLILPDQKTDTGYEESIENEYIVKNNDLGLKIGKDAVEPNDLEFLLDNYLYIGPKEYSINSYETGYKFRLSIYVFFRNEVGRRYLEMRIPFADDFMMDFIRGVSIKEIETTSGKVRIEKEITKRLNSLYIQEFLDEEVPENIPPVKTIKIKIKFFY